MKAHFSSQFNFAIRMHFQRTKVDKSMKYMKNKMWKTIHLMAMAETEMCWKLCVQIKCSFTFHITLSVTVPFSFPIPIIKKCGQILLLYNRKVENIWKSGQILHELQWTSGLYIKDTIENVQKKIKCKVNFALKFFPSY